MAWNAYQTRVSRSNPSAAMALAAAITSSKRSPGAPLREQRSGRLDRTRLSRVASGDTRVFVTPSAPTPQRLRVIILLDASGSMAGGRAADCMQMARNLADATERLPNVKADIWAHSTGGLGGDADMYHLWKSGQPTVQVNRYNNIQMGGNADGFAIAYVGDELRANLMPGEQGLVIVVSDGAPSYGPNPALHMRLVREDLKRSRIPVVSVSVAGSMDLRTQHLLYGQGNVVAYNPNPRVTARDMAKVIGRNLG